MKNIFRTLAALFLVTLLLTVQAAAQNNLPPGPTGQVIIERGPISNLVFNLSGLVLLFGFIVICLEVYLVKIKFINSDDVIKFITVTLIITGTLFLITAGYSNNQIAPAIGLFGTIAGYLVGKVAAGNRNQAPQNPSDNG